MAVIDVDQSAYSSFEVVSTANDARKGRLTVDGTVMETPNLFPVINFYGGGRESSLFGGSTHRTVKELINGADRVFGVDCSEHFPGSMMSVGSLTDYGISKNLLERYLDTPIKERSAFRGFDGILFTDSGGYKNLTKGGLDGSDFEIELNQKRVFRMQQQLGGDILVNLDVPIQPDDTEAERREKARQTAENAIEFARLAKEEGFNGAKYFTVHGYYYSMIDTYFSVVEEVFGNLRIDELFDGIALGSLVPKKDNKQDLIDAVTGCRQVMAERGLDHLPLHVLGISSSAMPLLAALGVDTFDSSTYIQNAIHGKYATSLMDSVPVDDADFSDCDCPVCRSKQLRKRMRGDPQYRKDKMGPVAVHNLALQQRELEEIRSCIRDGPDSLIDYIENSVGRNPSMRKYAHQVVNKALGGYF